MKTADQRIILITGASRGIGLAAARLLAERGAQVILASRDLRKAETASASLNGSVFPVALDITNENSIGAAVEKVTATFPRLDVLVNNAAILLDHYASLRDLTPDTLRDTFETNVIGTHRVTLSFLPLLERSSNPRIVNVSSGAGQLDGKAQAWAPAYSISKTALNMLTQQMTAAFPKIQVNSMCPGWCRTEMGGPQAPRSAEEGADTLVWLALDAGGDLRGCFVKDRSVISW